LSLVYHVDTPPDNLGKRDWSVQKC